MDSLTPATPAKTEALARRYGAEALPAAGQFGRPVVTLVRVVKTAWNQRSRPADPSDHDALEWAITMPWNGWSR